MLFFFFNSFMKVVLVKLSMFRFNVFDWNGTGEKKLFHKVPRQTV